MKEMIKKIFPWIVPLRERQRIYSFYKSMEKDGNTYSKSLAENTLENLQFEDKFVMINENTGFDIKYQENKIFNLKLVAKTLNNILIKPGEVFSFWQLAKDANKNTPYRDGLVVINGELSTAPAGGLCHISNLLCWMFLHTPLDFVERVGHRSREFPYPSDMLTGIDATIMEGLVDLKVKNNTKNTYQIQIDFDDEHMIGRVFTDNNQMNTYKIKNKNLVYLRKSGRIFEEVDIYREIYKENELIDSKFLYKNKCHIGYELSREQFVLEVVR